AASLAESLAFLVLAVVLLDLVLGWPLVALLAAVTPTVLFVATLVNPSGLELCANLAFICGLLRIGRDGRSARTGGDPRLSRWIWVATAASGAVTVLSWQLGPAFAVVDIVAVAGLSGREALG